MYKLYVTWIQIQQCSVGTLDKYGFLVGTVNGKQVG